MQTRTVALIAGASAAVAMTITGVTYASADAPQSASSAREAVRPASAPRGGDHDYGKRDHDGYKHDGYKKDRGEIQINERTYSANPGACVSVTNFLDAQTFNISNDTDDRVVEFFNGTNCDNGNPVATVLPGNSAFGVGNGGVDGSFRVIDNNNND